MAIEPVLTTSRQQCRLSVTSSGWMFVKDFEKCDSGRGLF